MTRGKRPVCERSQTSSCHKVGYLSLARVPFAGAGLRPLPHQLPSQVHVHLSCSIIVQPQSILELSDLLRLITPVQCAQLSVVCGCDNPAICQTRVHSALLLYTGCSSIDLQLIPELFDNLDAECKVKCFSELQQCWPKLCTLSTGDV